MCVVDGEASSSWTLPGCWANTDETANRTVSPATTIVLVMTSSDAGVCALRKSYGRIEGRRDTKIGPFPAPAASNRSCGFPASGFLAGRRRCPCVNRVGGEPERNVASLHERSLVLRPIPDAVLRLVLRMHSRLHAEIVLLRPSRCPEISTLLVGSAGLSSSPGGLLLRGPHRNRTRRFPPSGSSADVTRGYEPQMRTRIRGSGRG